MTTLNNFGFSSYDNYTKFIITAYMKIPTNAYFSHLTYFPEEIILIAMHYLGDHFMMYRGSYQWNIDNQLLSKMIAANNEEKFESDPFEMANLIWTLHVYPNGDDEDCQGSFNLFLNLKSMPSEWSELHVCCIFRCEQLNAQITYLPVFTAGDHTQGWHNDTLQLREVTDYILEMVRAWDDVIDLTFTVMINIARIKLQTCINQQTLFNFHKKTWKEMIPKSFTWTVDEKLLMEMKKARFKKSYFSPIYYDMWCLEIYPNGHETEGEVALSLQLCALPFGANVFNMSYQVCLKMGEIKREINEQNWFDTNSADEGYITEVDMDMEFEEFKKYEGLSIEIKIDQDENEKMRRIAVEKWKEYAKQRSVIDGLARREGKKDIIKELKFINDQVDALLHQKMNKMND